MNKRVVLMALPVALSLCLAGIPPLKVLPLGDSITQGVYTNSYRHSLWHKLRAAGYCVDFIGTMRTSDQKKPPNLDFDLDHEGHTGWTADSLLLALPGWLSQYTPDAVLIHAGHNDMKESGTLDQKIDRTIGDLRGVITALRADNPTIVIFLAKTILTHPVLDKHKRNHMLAALNLRIPRLGLEMSTAASPVIVVDHENAFDPLIHTGEDGVHPNEAGDEVIAETWFRAFVAHYGEAHKTLCSFQVEVAGTETLRGQGRIGPCGEAPGAEIFLPVNLAGRKTQEACPRSLSLGRYGRVPWPFDRSAQ